MTLPRRPRPAPTATGQGSSVTVLPEPVTLSSSRKIELSDVPSAVQKAIAAAAGGARIEDLERGTWQGQNVYQGAFKENGKHVELQVREDGTVLHDPRKSGIISRGASSPTPYASVTSPVPVSSGQKVEQKSLPGAVQRAITVHVGRGKNIEDIERGTWQGKTVYEVAFKDDNGRHTELQLDEKGRVVYDPRAKK
jgi:hypothetical protein